MNGSRTGSIEDSGSVGPAAAGEAALRQQNRAADGDVMGWPGFTVRWRTRRGWPTRLGWSAIAIVGFFLLVTLPGWLAHGTTSNLLEGIVVDLLAIGIGAVVIAFAPQLHQPETASWSLVVSSDSIQLDKEASGSARLSTVIRRVDAGHLELGTSKWNGRSNQPRLVSAKGSSIDGKTNINLADSWAGTGPLGLLPGVPLAQVLVSWWPANSKSVSALIDFEQLGRPYWHPDAAPSRTRPNVSRDF